jgi:AbrB family looped-hinge helix DNA binding protein
MSAIKKFNSKVAANGQVVLPKELRDSLCIKGGDTIVFYAEENEGSITISIRRPSTLFGPIVGVLSQLKGRPSKEILNELDSEEME